MNKSEEKERFARIGAAVRYAELQRELSAISTMFPDLSAGAASTPSPARKPRKAYKMSPAARKAVGDRMRKYWAERRKPAARQK